MPLPSLRTRLALVAAGLTLAGIALGLLLTYWTLLNHRLMGLDEESELLARLVLEAAVLREDQSVRIPRVVESYLTDEGGVRAAQVYVDGQLIWEGGVVNAPRPLDAEKLLVGRGARSSADWRVFTLRDEDGGIVVQVGRPLLGVREVLGAYDEIALAVTAVLSLLSGALAWGIVGVALRPLRQLATAIEGFERDGRVPEIPGSDEPARLARGFAALLSRLREEREREQRFLAYAAHELRTPLSALRAGLEAAHSGRLQATSELLGRLFREATRLEGLTQNLLALSRAEAGDTRLRPIDLEDLVNAAYDRFQPLALERGLELVLSASTAPAVGDPRLLEQAVDNLMSNALRATTRGRIGLASGTVDGQAFLELADTGSGLGEPLREGLGLRVVRAVAKAHGGTFELVGGRGTRARLLLPGRSAAPAEGGVLEDPVAGEAAGERSPS